MFDVTTVFMLQRCCIIAPWRKSKTRPHLSSNRSRRLLGVRSSDRYRWKATGLNFLFFWLGLSWKHSFVTKNSKNTLTSSQKHNFHRFTNYRNVGGMLVFPWKIRFSSSWSPSTVIMSKRHYLSSCPQVLKSIQLKIKNFCSWQAHPLNLAGISSLTKVVPFGMGDHEKMIRILARVLLRQPLGAVWKPCVPAQLIGNFSC